MPGKEDDCQHLIELSRAMLSHAEDQSWDKVMDLETSRRQCIATLFAEPIAPADGETVAKAIQESLLIDQKIKELAEIARFDILQVLQEMEQGKKAIKAYTS